MSDFCGLIDEIDGLSVDCFLEENTLRSTAFFLSHCHTDHMRGLSSISFSSHIASRPNEFIYCSEVSARLLKNLFGDNEGVLGKVKPLSLGPNQLQVPIKDSDYSTDMVVTLLPAGHCLGSCMFIFETRESKVLYTGDFRFNSCDLPKMIHLHQKNKEVITFDSVYLDTTFWCQTNTHFPTRMESLELIVESIDKFMTETGNLGHIHIDRPGRIGSEYFMTELCKRYGKKIHVGLDSWQTYNGIEEVMSCLTINSEKEATFLHMCQSFGPNQRKRRLPCVPHYVNVLHIRPTAQWYSCGQEFFPKKYESDFVHISNSMHSSRAELIDFIKYLKPKKVVPCVTPKDCLKSQVTDEIDLILKEMNEGPSTRRKRGAGRWSLRRASKKASTSGFGDELDYQEN